MVHVAINAMCDALEAVPGQRDIVSAAHSLLNQIFLPLVDPALRDTDIVHCTYRRRRTVSDRSVATFEDGLELSLSILAADAGDDAGWRPLESSRAAAFFGALLAGFPGAQEWVVRIDTARPTLSRRLATRITEHVEALAQVGVRAAELIDTFNGIFELMWRELIVTSTFKLPSLRGALTETRSAAAFLALARTQLVERQSRCQLSLDAAITIASTLPSDRVLALIGSGLLETFTILYLGGNSISNGRIGAARRADGATLRSPYSDCAAKVALLAEPAALRSAIRDRLAPLLSPMLLGLSRNARSHDYGACGPLPIR